MSYFIKRNFNYFSGLILVSSLSINITWLLSEKTSIKEKSHDSAFHQSNHENGRILHNAKFPSDMLFKTIIVYNLSKLFIVDEK